MFLKKFLMLSGFAFAGVAGAVAGEMEFSYNEDGSDYMVYGFNKKETYDIAIKVDDPTLVGCRVTGMYVPLPSEPEWLENVTAWMSKELTLEKKVNVPDIASQQATVDNDVLDVTFDEPYVLTKEGLYVGYSFTVTELGDYSNQPIACVYGKAEGGLMVHTSRTRLKWTDLSEDMGIVSAMVVRLETDFGPSDVALSIPDVSYAAKDETAYIDVTVANHGESPLERFAYSYSAGEFAGGGEVTLDAPIAPGKKGNVSVGIDAIPEVGSFPLCVTIDTFNGLPNSDANRSAEGVIEVLPFLPVNRPLVEEFTGLNCGYCPRGFVAMEQMGHDYPELFVGMAYHGGGYERGCMAAVPASDWPMDVSSFPNGTINRESLMDPSYFTSRWNEYRKDMPVADLNVDIEWSDESKAELRAVSDVRFVYDYSDAGYRLSFALVADGLTNEAWKQSNYYSGDTPDSNTGSPYWEPFVNGGSSVEGLVFNDVVAHYDDVQGIEGSLPAEISAGESLKYEYAFTMADVKNDRNEYFINSGATLHVVAIILDRDGRVINCNKSASLPVSGSVATSVERIETAAEVVKVSFVDMQGRVVENPTEGIYIKEERLSDGSVRHTKIAL